MDTKRLKALIELLEASDVSELTVEENGVRMTVRKGPLTIIESENRAVGSGTSAIPTEAAAPSAETEAAGETEGPYKKIESPMVGTIFLSAAPGQDAFVSEGDHVDKGQTVCIVEAMKIMNEIAADEPGLIVKILVKDGDTVEFGQPLFLYDPA